MQVFVFPHHFNFFCQIQFFLLISSPLCRFYGSATKGTKNLLTFLLKTQVMRGLSQQPEKKKAEQKGVSSRYILVGLRKKKG